MISPPGIRGVAFCTRLERDGRANGPARIAISQKLGISNDWATVRQVHSDRTIIATEPVFYGEADGLVTDIALLPLAIATADCVPVVLVGERTRAVVHAGWRGVAGGVVPEARRIMADANDAPRLAILGPHICGSCYEVGAEVNEAIGGFVTTTSRGTNGADLAAAIRSQLGDVETVDTGVCTYEDQHLASYREDGTSDRQVTVVWIP